MKDLSVEYAHIYTNSKISDEQKLSLEILENIKEDNKSLVVLVDDYSFPDPTFNYDEFLAWLSEHGHKPDLVMRESQLIPLCDQVLQLMEEGELKESLISYIKTKKYPCSLFIAAWYLLRLGVLRSSEFPESESASKLINILPKSFESYEDKAREVIATTKYANLLDCIENKYFEGRAID
tara:strand:- start:6747 stop:7286 length:540 start_codon:yes stop_codon:yes gene_type:complete